jgi:hypothetical protein
MGIRTALPICLLALAPLGARAQTAGQVLATETSSTGGLSDEVINTGECAGTVASSITLAWQADGIPASGTVWRLKATKGACTDTSGLVDLVGSDIPTNGTASGNYGTAISVGSVVAALVLNACDPTATSTQTIALCVKNLSGSTEVPSGPKAVGSIVLDTRRPKEPTAVSASPGDSALDVSWTRGSTVPVDSGSYTATARACASVGARPCTGATKTCDASVGSTTSCRITGLSNGTEYEVTVVAFSAVLNPSVASAAAYGSPVPVDDFWRHYQNAGGHETGGCGSGGAGLLALLSLLPLALRRRNP